MWLLLLRALVCFFSGTAFLVPTVKGALRQQTFSPLIPSIRHPPLLITHVHILHVTLAMMECSFPLLMRRPNGTYIYYFIDVCGEVELGNSQKWCARVWWAVLKGHLFVGPVSASSMTKRQLFTFEPIHSQRVESLMADSFFKSVYERWGLHHKTRIQAFRFERECASGGGGGNIFSAPPIQFSGFHKGLLEDFLHSFFSAQHVRESLGLSTNAETLHRQENIDFDELRCSWTTLKPFKRLVDAGVVRCVDVTESDVATNGIKDSKDRNVADELDTPTFDGARMPVVRRADFYLPHDIIVADELRALFLLAHNKAVTGDGEDDDYMDDYGFSFGSGGVSLPILRGVFGDMGERSEFLYHVLWRLVAGGGTNNQWDEEFTVYLEAARMLYKALVSIRAVPGTTNGRGGNEDEPDRAMDEEDATAALQPEVVSTVACVKTLGGLKLFERHDDAEPSNLNYCYVCVNPLQAQVIVWYHCF
ncbi:hypothetical protein TRVL_04896 [Trypanosoma vivax]|uniref:Cilia- and flagella-associated protein 300 n=1 Tax=Trypanosoma vivax (strain Y486) TaxID=1055687 RepID=G0TZV8_TRYVY|nr:hypothetical protein TRVL_04896 [Trypanosoma vivax]CCC50136.1 conserved hypothetical protein [Trypanosoma vivax Y486]